MSLRTLVTGGAGMIGSHLCDRLVADGHSVTAMDNLITGRRENLAQLMGNSRFQFIEHDVTSPILLDQPPDRIYHLASPASPADFARIPIQILKVGSLGTHRVLGTARASGARVLLASTSEVYGDPEVHPQTEGYFGNVNPIGIRGAYDEAKRFAEAMTMAYHRHHGVETRIVRIFNTYGPRHPLDGRVLPNFVTQALRNEPITLYGDGSQTRSFQYVTDLVEGMVRLMEATGDDVIHPVNMGNPNEITIKQFAEELIALTGSSSPLVNKPLPQDDPKQRCADISRAKALLGWEPVVSRHDGLTKTVAGFRERLGVA
jgi:dTDP-glucose 4,6-dehydratase